MKKINCFKAYDVRGLYPAEIDEAVGETSVKDAELELARQVIGSLEGEFEPTELKSEYRSNLRAMLEAKLAGEEIARKLGMRPFTIQTKAKPIYHAGAVFASNYLVVVEAIAQRLLRHAGLSDADAWAALRSLGRSGLADLVERNCRLAKRFARAFSDAGFPVLNDVVLNQVLVSFGDAERHLVVEALGRGAFVVVHRPAVQHADLESSVVGSAAAPGGACRRDPGCGGPPRARSRRPARSRPARRSGRGQRRAGASGRACRFRGPHGLVAGTTSAPGGSPGRSRADRGRMRKALRARQRAIARTGGAGYHPRATRV